jgi:hypothetical protein
MDTRTGPGQTGTRPSGKDDDQRSPTDRSAGSASGNPPSGQ